METKTLKIIEGSLMEKQDEISLLLPEHWEESARNKELMVLNPDKKQYEAAENLGRLVSLFAYVNNELVGYSVNIITPHLHYSDLTVAYNDIIFLKKEYRNTSLGLKLIKQTEEAVKNKGAKLILWHAKQDTPLSQILPRLGCQVQEIVFSKQL